MKRLKEIKDISSNLLKIFLNDQDNVFLTGSANNNKTEEKIPKHLIGGEQYLSLQENYLSLSRKLYAMKTVVLNLSEICGNIYNFSDYTFVLIIYQALEITLENGYNGEKFEGMMELYTYQLILTSLREDHQILFSFYYSLSFMKELQSLDSEEWKYFISGIILIINILLISNNNFFSFDF